MTSKVKKAVIPVAGMGTRFLPLSKIYPKELLPLADKPIIQYIVEEIFASGIKEIIFINKPGKKDFLEYLKPDKNFIKFLKQRKREHLAKELECLNKLSKACSFSQKKKKKPLGDGHAILQAKKLVGNEPCAFAWADDVVESKTPCLLQMLKVFEKYQKPVIGLARVPKQSFPNYGMIKGKKIKNRLYKLEEIVEKPSIKESPSNLAIIGRYILTSKMFKELEKAKPNDKGEIGLSEFLAKKLAEGEEIYGYEFEGKWLECGNKLDYLKSNFYLSLRHPKFGPEIKKSLKK